VVGRGPGSGGPGAVPCRRRKLTEAKIPGVLISTMRRFPALDGVVYECARAASGLSCDEEGLECLGKEGLCQAICDTLRHGPVTSTCFELLFSLIVNMARACEDNRRDLGQIGACGLIVDLTRRQGFEQYGPTPFLFCSAVAALAGE
jgi:hypothetical protein